MKFDNEQAESIDEYLERLPGNQKAALKRLRKVIRDVAPDAVETIGYRMPLFKYYGSLVSFAAFKDHLSFFVMSTSVMNAYKDDLEDYDVSKGTIRFQPDRPLPAALVKKLVRARIEENKTKQQTGRGKPPARRPRHPMPSYVRRGLEDRGLMDAYMQRPPYQRNDYIGWITGAKQEGTRQRRLEQMLDELRRGDLYMKMAYKPKRGKRVTS